MIKFAIAVIAIMTLVMATGALALDGGGADLTPKEPETKLDGGGAD